MHPEAEELVARAHFTPFVSFAIVAAHLHFLLRRPLTYLSVLWTLVRANWGSTNFLLGGLAIFPKAVYFARRMQQLGVRHIHAHFANHPAAAAYVAGRLSRIPYSFTAHGADLQVDQHMLREKVAAAKGVVAISHDNKRLIESVCGSETARRVAVIRCGVDTSVFGGERRTAAEESDRPLRIACVGTLYEVKGHTYLIDACRLLVQAGLPVQCHLVGDGPLRDELEQQVARGGLNEHVRFHGRRTRAEIADLLDNCDVLVAPSVPTTEGRREGIPVVLMEAMASGLPVVASKLSGIPELVTDRESGWLVAPRDPEALAEALTTLSRDGELRRRLGRAGREKVLSELDLDKNARRLADLFLGGAGS